MSPISTGSSIQVRTFATIFLSSMNPLIVYDPPDGAFASTGNETTVYFFPPIDSDFAVAFVAAAASFRNPGGERLIHVFAAQLALAAMFAVLEASAPGSKPPPPGSNPVLGSAGRDCR